MTPVNNEPMLTSCEISNWLPWTSRNYNWQAVLTSGCKLINFRKNSSDGLGMRKATEFWGYALQKFHNKSVAKRNSANELRYLGYYTDAGAYYYYNTEEGLDYDQE